MKKTILVIISIFALFSTTLSAQTTLTAVAPTINSGDTSWMIVATAFVLLMSIPGLALFYGGLVRRKNVLNVFMQVIFLVSVITVEWIAVGYSNSFGTNSIESLRPFIGGFDWAFLNHINMTDLSPYFVSHFQLAADGSKVGTIPHIVFVMFQCMFAVITPALIIGAFAERINFKGFVLFSILWSLLIIILLLTGFGLQMVGYISLVYWILQVV